MSRSLSDDGAKVEQSPEFDTSHYLLDTDAPLTLGGGINGNFNGKIRDLRIYQRALSPSEIETLARHRPDGA